jgi:peptidoglycan-associated lipoprotein
MGRRSASVVVASLLVAVVGSGCASQSGSTQASTGGTSGGQSGHGMAGAAVVPVSQAQSERHSTMASATVRPSPKDFVAIANLRDVHFDFDRYDIRAADTGILDASAAWLKAHPEHTLLIEGHADERGTNEYNLSLGERRAKASMNYLTARGVQAARITITSYGEERNVCGEKSDHCWSKNRRAHFMVKAR